jgi:hypothetical protein
MLDARELNTIVNAAISKGNVATITKVLGLPGTDVNSLAADGGSSPMQTLFGSALTPQYVEVLALLLQNGADPNLAQPGVSPPLTQLLASMGSLSSRGVHLLPALKLLLDKGANPNLHLSGCNPPLVQVLLGVPVENIDQRLTVQPHLSTSYEKLRFAVANLLIQHGADPRSKQTAASCDLLASLQTTASRQYHGHVTQVLQKVHTFSLDAGDRASVQSICTKLSLHYLNSSAQDLKAANEVLDFIGKRPCSGYLSTRPASRPVPTQASLAC